MERSEKVHGGYHICYDTILRNIVSMDKVERKLEKPFVTIKIEYYKCER
jgi:hypothetical protein